MAKKKPASSPTFEESLEQLEAIVSKLEGGQLPLDDSLQQYELGIRSLGLCYKMLAHVEKKVELLSGLDAQGKPLTEPFGDLEEEPEDDSNSLLTQKNGDSLAKNGTSRSRRRSRPAGKKPPTNLSPTDMDSPSSIDASTNIDEGGTLF